MNFDTLIDSLASDLKPVPRHAVGRRLLLGMAGGGAVTLLLISIILGVRSDLGLAMRGFAFWMKWAYTISLGIGAVALVARLARPEPIRLIGFWPVTIPFALLAALAVTELAHVPSSDWFAMWLGASWKKCPWLVLMLSAPIFAGLLWSFRRLAPTRLRVAGAAAGLSAGAWAATLYCLHCPEVSALFVLTWYTLGILLAAGAGAWIGPRLLRW
ncbi:DUF1109 domain-containing protein [Sphingobium sufflavum]|uniref:DUF1109 domain-containing protein n=1 Tax=Sphingobium sufflavum TaxID=1129547 RepID=UPI001F23125B|nr:DUF1109 domain-containing protein [Sphingobium sufflavum]MCE7796011.1 DUF1109 domain-containing protein [Sphingobium sufflavum]